MKTKVIIILMCALIISCGDYRQTNSGYKIKGKAEIAFNQIDESLNGKSLVTGYVYSRNIKEFLAGAVVKIGNQECRTDKNGYFSTEIISGKYIISTNYVGHNEESINNVSVEKSHRIILIFKLGTTAIECKEL